MRLIETCMHIENLRKKADENVKTLIKMHENKNKSSKDKEEYQDIFEKTIKIMNEYDFYKNQIDEIDEYVTIKKY